MTRRSVVVSVLMVAGSTLGATKVLQNDRFSGTGPVSATVGFAEFEGAAVLFTPQAADYPLNIIAIDVLAVPYSGGSAGAIGAWLIDLWDESQGTLTPPTLFDGGQYVSQLNQQGVRLTAMTSTFNRFTLPQRIVVNSGKVFVAVSQQSSTADDGITIALDQGPRRPGSNWSFNGRGVYRPIDLPDGGSLIGLGGNWIIRLVVEVPDVPVVVTSITPNTGPTSQVTPVVIDGSSFELGARAFVGTTELTLQGFTTSRLNATVPNGLAPGRYAVKVRNPTGLEGTLPNGFTVLLPDGGLPEQGAAGGSAGGGSAGGGTSQGGGASGTGGGAPAPLSVDDVTPNEVFADDENKLVVTGGGFQTGAQVLIGSVLFDPVDVRSANVISLTLAKKALPVGTHDVTVLNLSGAKATAAKALTVKAGARVAPTGCSCGVAEPAALLFAGLVMLTRRRRA